MGLLHYLVTQQTWIFTMWLIPISLCFDIYWWFRIRINYLTAKSKTRHQEKVIDIQRQIEDWKKSGSQQPMCTARPQWMTVTLQRITYKERMCQIKMDLADIINIDKENRVVRVEPRVTIGNLNDFLISQGWTLPIVPELDELTISGLVMGGGIESTSHKYGLFNHICKAYEIVLGDGRCVQCSPSENKELFAAQAFSYGTLGFLTAIDIEIIPYKPYLKLTYHNLKTLDGIVDKFEEVTNDPEVDSVEGIMYTLNSGVVMSGQFVDRVPPTANYNPLGRWYKPWFFKHVETFMQDDVQAKGNVEYVPTYDFIHRHNKSYFWLMDAILHFANHPLFRYLLGWACPPRFPLIKAMKHTLLPEEANVNSIIQDYVLDLKHLKESLQYCDQHIKIYPIWLCPARVKNQPELKELFPDFLDDPCHVDIGIYGWSPLEGFNPEMTQKRMEKFCMDREGYAALYSETQLTREEFDQMFASLLGVYEKVRKDLKCERAFPHVYEKISKLGRKTGY